MAEIKTIYLFLSRVVDRQKDKMNGEVKMKFNIKSDVDTTRKEIESALKNNEQEKQETQSYLNKKKNNKVKWDRTKWIISIILLLAGIIFVGVNNGLAYSTVKYTSVSFQIFSVNSSAFMAAIWSIGSDEKG